MIGAPEAQAGTAAARARLAFTNWRRVVFMAAPDSRCCHSECAQGCGQGILARTMSPPRLVPPLVARPTAHIPEFQWSDRAAREAVWTSKARTIFSWRDLARVLDL